MELHTKVRIPTQKGLCTYNNPILCMGSCFASMMGDKLSEAKFTTLANPMGILYNPVSLANCLALLMDESQFPVWTYADHLQSWHSFDLHSLVSHPDKDMLQAKTEEILQQARAMLKESPLMILTLGTAMGYRHKESGRIVGNCHKYPASHFHKEMLSLDNLVEKYVSLLDKLVTAFPDIRLLLTVSPIRHTKDTLSLNSVSKSILRILCHTLSERYEWVTYFPAYEIMMDELRDYRFYAADMIHPTPTAEKWIWEKFIDAFLEEEDYLLFQRWEKIRIQLAHRPKFPHAEGHKIFLQNLYTSLQAISTRLDCEEELAYVQKQLNTYSGK